MRYVMHVALLLALVTGVEAPPSRLAVIRPAPDFTLLDTAGKQVALQQFRGKAILVGFVFTTCSGSCPATTHRMAKVQHELAQHADLKGRVQLVSITLDPE